MLYHSQNPHGGDIYSREVKLDYSANINPYGTPAAVMDAISQAGSLLSKYPDPYCRELVAAIAAFESVPAAQILCGNGAAELIFAYCHAVKAKKALLLAPTFCEYEQALRSVGTKISYFYLSQQEDFAVGDGILTEISQTDADLILLCNPNNPTGKRIDPARMTKIADLCSGLGKRLFVDECFLDLCQDGESHTLKPLLSQHPEIFLLKAFTKSYGMAGVRLGYCLTADEALLAQMSKSVQPWNVSVLAQKAGVAALKQQPFLEKARQTITRERQLLQSGLKALGLKVVDSETNFILFSSEKPLYEPLMARGIQIRRCGNYPGLSECWYRIAVKLPEENQILLQELEEVLHG